MQQFSTDYNDVLAAVERVNPVKYASTRNYEDGWVTKLSPYISRGLISTKHVLDSVVNRGYKPYEYLKLMQELAWREYFYEIWWAKGDAIFNDLKQPQGGVIHYGLLEVLVHSKTGINAIDKAIDALYATGYMHNHLRMYVAAIATNFIGAHWSMPAKWMYYHLLDGDIASNTCSWQWVAGCMGKKYIMNQENINKYCGNNQFSTPLDTPYESLPPIGSVQEWVPQCSMDFVTPLHKYNNSVYVDKDKPLLLYHSYHLDPNWRPSIDANRILVLEPSHFERFPVSSHVLDFIVGLSKNIDGLQIFVGEVGDIPSLSDCAFIATKEHPSVTHYPGIKDRQEKIFENVTGYYPSFFNYWKQCEKTLKKK